MMLMGGLVQEAILDACGGLFIRSVLKLEQRGFGMSSIKIRVNDVYGSVV